jgi:hypothetical protein
MSNDPVSCSVRSVSAPALNNTLGLVSMLRTAPCMKGEAALKAK